MLVAVRKQALHMLSVGSSVGSHAAPFEFGLHDGSGLAEFAASKLCKAVK